jgi:outer membrane murein-binding lipoprotein Lpp
MLVFCKTPMPGTNAAIACQHSKQVRSLEAALQQVEEEAECAARRATAAEEKAAAATKAMQVDSDLRQH